MIAIGIVDKQKIIDDAPPIICPWCKSDKPARCIDVRLTMNGNTFEMTDYMYRYHCNNCNTTFDTDLEQKGEARE